MRYLFSFMTLLFFWAKAFTQVTMKAAEIPNFLERMPSLPATVEEAYKAIYPKTKEPPYQQYNDTLKAAITTLAIEAAGRSYLLITMADRMERDDRKFDRVHNQIPRDRDLENRIRDINNSFFNEADDLGRTLGNAYDSINKLNYPAIDKAALQLELYSKEIFLYIKKVKKILVETNAYMNKRGYNAVLDNHDTANKFYIQLLEVRGLMYDRIQKVLQQVIAAWTYSADMVDICKKYPDSCK